MDARLSGLLLAATLCAGAQAAGPGPAPDALAGVAAEVARRHPDIEHLEPSAVAALHAQPGARLILLDVREPAEYAISHLPGAIRVDPAADAEAVLHAVGPLPRGAQVLVYCSVGVRSARLADRVGPELRAHGAAQIANLRGGIFAWHNQGRPLRDSHGDTDAVHGYDARWARLLTRPGARLTGPD